MHKYVGKREKDKAANNSFHASRTDQELILVNTRLQFHINEELFAILTTSHWPPPTACPTTKHVHPSVCSRYQHMARVARSLMTVRYGKTYPSLDKPPRYTWLPPSVQLNLMFRSFDAACSTSNAAKTITTQVALGQLPELKAANKLVHASRNPRSRSFVGGTGSPSTACTNAPHS